MKTKIIISALIACFSLLGLQLKAEAKLVPIGQCIADKIASLKLSDNAESQIMQALVIDKVRKAGLTGWTPGNGFLGGNYSGSFDFFVKLSPSGNYSVFANDKYKNLVYSGKIEGGAGVEVETTFGIKLTWDIVVPLDTNKKTDTDANLIVKFNYIYNRDIRDDKAELPVSLNDILKDSQKEDSLVHFYPPK
jgi:hypothetical protein